MKDSLELKETEEMMDTLYAKSNQIKAQKNIKMVKRKLNEYLENNKFFKK